MRLRIRGLRIYRMEAHIRDDEGEYLCLLLSFVLTPSNYYIYALNGTAEPTEPADDGCINLATPTETPRRAAATMGYYVLYSTLFLFLTLATAAYLTRTHWLSLLRSSRTSSYLPLPTSFFADAESGLSSSTFDLSANISSLDSRSGLDDAAKTEIIGIMRGGWFRRGMGFDEARRVYMERMLEREGIGRDGRPRDPKFVSFS
ncbi:hypothetical protein VE00_01166 [Pseudogymnoascus sp. WSF 3629]|nr:hypothetical protein VE00_01166 [Pseudogymnoascus sp. WSF 3629]